MAGPHQSPLSPSLPPFQANRLMLKTNRFAPSDARASSYRVKSRRRLKTGFLSVHIGRRVKQASAATEPLITVFFGLQAKQPDESIYQLRGGWSDTQASAIRWLMVA